MFKQISADEAKQMMGSMNVTLLDTRDAESFAKGHIADAKNLSRDKVDEFSKTADKSQTVIVYCYKGISCRNVAQYLSEQGFSKVYSMDGGFDGWVAKYPVTK